MENPVFCNVESSDRPINTLNTVINLTMQTVSACVLSDQTLQQKETIYSCEICVCNCVVGMDFLNDDLNDKILFQEDAFNRCFHA